MSCQTATAVRGVGWTVQESSSFCHIGLRSGCRSAALLAAQTTSLPHSNAQSIERSQTLPGPTLQTAVWRMASKPPSGASRLPEIRSFSSSWLKWSMLLVRRMTFLKEKGGSASFQGSRSLVGEREQKAFKWGWGSHGQIITDSIMCTVDEIAPASQTSAGHQQKVEGTPKDVRLMERFEAGGTDESE